MRRVVQHALAQVFHRAERLLHFLPLPSVPLLCPKASVVLHDADRILGVGRPNRDRSDIWSVCPAVGLLHSLRDGFCYPFVPRSSGQFAPALHLDANEQLRELTASLAEAVHAAR